MLRAVLAGLALVLFAAPSHGQAVAISTPVATHLGGDGYVAGGSHFIFWDVIDGYLKGCRFCGNEKRHRHNRQLFLPGAVKAVVGNYHTDTAQVIKARLQEMYQNGQRMVTLPLYFSAGVDDCMFLVPPWTADTIDHCHTDAAYDGDGAWGYVIPLENWRLPRPENLVGILNDIMATGFTQVNIRFIPGSPTLSPQYWPWCGPSWTEDQELTVQNTWEFQKSVIDLANATANGRIHLVYDLGGDIGGYSRNAENSDLMFQPYGGCHSAIGHAREWMRSLWRKYTSRVCTEGWPSGWTGEDAMKHTVGFSFANRIRYSGGRTAWRRQTVTDHVIDIYDFASRGADTLDPQPADTAGESWICGQRWRPATLAFDVGKDVAGVGGGFKAFFDELGNQLTNLGDYRYPVVLWEAGYNDRVTANGIKYALSRGLNLRYAIQWPSIAGATPGQDFSVTYTPKFSCYSPLGTRCGR